MFKTKQISPTWTTINILHEHAWYICVCLFVRLYVCLEAFFPHENDMETSPLPVKLTLTQKIKNSHVFRCFSDNSLLINYLLWYVESKGCSFSRSFIRHQEKGVRIFDLDFSHVTAGFDLEGVEVNILYLLNH